MRAKHFVYALLTVGALTLPHHAHAAQRQEIIQAIIQESIDSYRGNCPCPYNTASNGSRCGGRSAYSRDGGASPICYAKDVTPQMIRQYAESRRDF